MNLKLSSVLLSIFSLFYVGSASASLLVTHFTGELTGFNGTTANVTVSFAYDSESAGLYTGSAGISDFGDYHANGFVLVSHNDHLMTFDATDVTGDTTSSLFLFGNFFDWSPQADDFGFDNRSYAPGNTYGSPHFAVLIDNTSRYTVEVNPVPVPAAVWLFGSGLVGLVGVARRKIEQK